MPLGVLTEITSKQPVEWHLQQKFTKLGAKPRKKLNLKSFAIVTSLYNSESARRELRQKGVPIMIIILPVGEEFSFFANVGRKIATQLHLFQMNRLHTLYFPEQQLCSGKIGLNETTKKLKTLNQFKI